MNPAEQIEIHPDVYLWLTTRHGGVSQAPYDSLNLGDHVGDGDSAVQANRQIVSDRCALPGPVNWMQQVHGTKLIDDSARSRYRLLDPQSLENSRERLAMEGDAAITRVKHEVLSMMTADCFPVLFYSEADKALALVHAGWRGLANGILEKTAAHFSQISLVWLGPGIRQCHFEVGSELKDWFSDQSFGRGSHGSALMLNLPRVIREKCDALGVPLIIDDGRCTYCESKRFFSYRRDGATGRFATLAYLA